MDGESSVTRTTGWAERLGLRVRAWEYHPATETTPEAGHLMNTLKTNIFMPGQDHNYLVGGNLTGAFALGSLGSTEDFFLVGAEPRENNGYPLLSGNILDSDGNLLCRLDRNELTINPGHCSKIEGDLVKYAIRDAADEPILAVKTAFERVGQNETYLTTLSGRFYDKSGRLVFLAESGGPHERIETGTKSLIGYVRGNGIGLVTGMTEDEVDQARSLLDGP